MSYDSPPHMAARVPVGYVTVGSIPPNGGEFETCFARKIRWPKIIQSQRFVRLMPNV